MSRRFYYLLSLVFVFVIPALVVGVFVWENIPITALLSFVILITILGSLWDIWATRHGSKDPIWLWQFNYREILGLKIFGLPVEEYLFYIASSLYIVFVWEGIKMALTQDVAFMYFLIPVAGLWSLTSILVSFKLGVNKEDRFKGNPHSYQKN